MICGHRSRMFQGEVVGRQGRHGVAEIFRRDREETLIWSIAGKNAASCQ